LIFAFGTLLYVVRADVVLLVADVTRRGGEHVDRLSARSRAPGRLDGSVATRCGPVPIASSSAVPAPARSARRSTAGSTTVRIEQLRPEAGVSPGDPLVEVALGHTDQDPEFHQWQPTGNAAIFGHHE
jgi:hypothetical protein